MGRSRRSGPRQSGQLESTRMGRGDLGQRLSQLVQVRMYHFGDITKIEPIFLIALPKRYQSLGNVNQNNTAFSLNLTILTSRYGVDGKFDVKRIDPPAASSAPPSGKAQSGTAEGGPKNPIANAMLKTFASRRGFGQR